MGGATGDVLGKLALVHAAAHRIRLPAAILIQLIVLEALVIVRSLVIFIVARH